MSKYDNGDFTKQLILDTGKKLFYEKGYHSTSFADICREAHVTRSTIYYHFPTKEDLRYEIAREYINECKRAAEPLCPEPKLHPLLTVFVMWKLLETDGLFRTLVNETFADTPVFQESGPSSDFFFHVLNDLILPDFYKQTPIPFIHSVSLYAYTSGFLQYLCQDLVRLPTLTLLEEYVRNIPLLLKLPSGPMEELLAEAMPYLKQID